MRSFSTRLMVRGKVVPENIPQPATDVCAPARPAGLVRPRRAESSPPWALLFFFCFQEYLIEGSIHGQSASRFGNMPESDVHYVPDEDTQKAYITYEKTKILVRPGALKIMWAKDSHSWKRDQGKGTFEIVQVLWLEVTGSIKLDKLEKGATYKLVFNVRVRDQASGFDEPVQVMGRVANEKHIWKKVYINDLARNTDTDIPAGELTFSLDKDKVYGPDDEFSFGLFEIWSGTWKGGLAINSVTILKKA